MPKKTAKKTNKKNRTSEIQGVIIFVASAACLLSLASFSLHGNGSNWLGMLGHTLGRSLTILFGLPSYLLCLYTSWIGWRLLFSKPLNHIFTKTVFAILGISSACILLNLIEDVAPAAATWLNSIFYSYAWQRKIHYHLGGIPFYYLYRDLPFFNLHTFLNAPGIALIFSGLFLASILFLMKVNPLHLLAKIPVLFSILKNGVIRAKDWIQSLEWKKAPDLLTESTVTASAASKEAESDFLRYVKLRIPSLNSQFANQTEHASPDMLAIQPETDLKSRPSLSRKAQTEKPHEQKMAPELSTTQTESQQSTQKSAEPAAKKRRDAALAAQKIHNGDFTAYKLPSLSLLTNAKKLDHTSLKKDLRRKAEVLEETLQSFGIEAKVGQINCGPTITSFEVQPAIGVKVQKIRALENDIALNMEAKSIRILAPIPGKAVVGIEVPNAQAEEVGFKEMLANYQQSGKKFHIPILLGKAVNGDYVMNDLTKMPHCIIAGATGSGKSVCINTIVMSILMNAKPDEIKLIMVDPKKVELTAYTKLPHMLAPVITEPQGACAAMHWLVKEMEKRYEMLKQVGSRNIEAFNNRKIEPDAPTTIQNIEIPEKLPYIVGIIDELADLMMVSSSDIETPIARIAQMARAVGIHLILATQRPSREVITGLIKANFPTRISFKVSSRVNSQIVLDDIGAESLLGNGDMLLLPPGSSHLTRAQGAFIRDEDINNVVKYINEQAPPRYVIESFDQVGFLPTTDDEAEDEPGDALYKQALDTVLGTGNASTTFLQRKLKIGYARAASLIDMMEQKGILGPAEGSKPRKILVARPNSSDDEIDENAN